MFDPVKTSAVGDTNVVYRIDIRLQGPDETVFFGADQVLCAARDIVLATMVVAFPAVT